VISSAPYRNNLQCLESVGFAVSYITAFLNSYRIDIFKRLAHRLLSLHFSYICYILGKPFQDTTLMTILSKDVFICLPDVIPLTNIPSLFFYHFSLLYIFQIEIKVYFEIIS
jgi:hypothetical protein